MTATWSWRGALTAMSSLAHGGETRGTITLLRRELFVLPDGRLLRIPIVSGNTLRGRLRRIGEELLRDVLGYDSDRLPIAAAHALRSGGSLAKTSREPLSGARLATVRDLVPQIGVFGAAAGGIIIDGALDVGKVVPHLAETQHITGVETATSAFSATQLEPYSRHDDTFTHDFAEVSLRFDADGTPHPVGDTTQMLFHIETFPAGTTFTTWLRLRRPTPMQAAFFADVLTAFAADGRLGGRVGIGHGRITLQLDPAHLPPVEVDWRQDLTDRRAEVFAALTSLT